MMAASYMDGKSKSKSRFKKLKATLQDTKNLYPPLEYQEFIESKINYYSYCKSKNLDIMPTFTMTAEEYRKLGHDVSIRKAFEFMQHEELNRVIAKPVLGMGGADVEFFNASGAKARTALSRYFKKCMKKYPGLVLQRVVKGFGMSKECPELRMYFLGDEYQYSVSANENCVLSHPEAEGGTLKVPLEKVKAVTQKIIKKLPPIVMHNGVRVPRMITRLDMGWRIDGKNQPFMNEVEIEPSLYLYKPLKEELLNYIKGCAKQMVNITRRYVKGNQASGKSSRHVRKTHFLKHRPYSEKK